MLKSQGNSIFFEDYFLYKFLLFGAARRKSKMENMQTNLEQIIESVKTLPFEDLEQILNECLAKKYNKRGTPFTVHSIEIRSRSFGNRS